jgi:hypothetical protein
MNERIKKLYTEASEWALHNYPPPVNPFEWEDLRSKKFAELIVQEMCQVINADCELQYSEGITTNLGGLNQARELIKQHFGVEE